MRTRGARQRVQALLATTFLIAAAGSGFAEENPTQQTPAQAKPAQSEQGLDANAQAVTLDPIDVQTNSGGTDGYVANSTSVATKSNTPLINIPQSVSVATKDFIKDAGFQNFTDFTRYVPGVAVHQGEGNRDELVIRGVDSSANFFVNGFRDDVQYFRDFYNAQSVDVRFNAFYEGTDTFRDYGQIERYGINPTVTLKPNDTTSIKLSYEYFHDERTSDPVSYTHLTLPTIYSV